MTSKDEIKERVLTENTAQGILNRLTEFESNRAHTQRRWIWELLQNARDTAADYDTELVASVEIDGKELTFKHNGQGFTMEQVAHLIYHGSTKVEEADPLGRFGSGFLTTHLLSPEIDVSGQLIDGGAFSFLLKREIDSTKALSDSMDKAWEDFNASIGLSSGTLADSFTTLFRYPVVEESVGAVEEGVKTLRQCAPFVVVFNRQFRRVSFESPEETIAFEVVKRVPLKERWEAVTVEVTEHGSLREQNYLLAEGELASVTIPMVPTDNGAACLPLGEIPRLFLGFPLVGTETFSFPAVINSFKFTPTEGRDGVYLGRSDNEENSTNQAAIEEACELYLQLIAFVADSQWSNSHVLAEIPALTEQVWLSKDWLQNRLGHLVSQLRQTPAVISGGLALAPQDSVLPIANGPMQTTALWELLHGAADFRHTLPVKAEAVGWREAVASWAAITGKPETSFSESYDGGKLVSHVECGTLEGLEDLLQDDVDAVKWLDRLYRFLQDDGFDHLVRERPIVLDQAGCLDKLSNLYRDNGISQELKAIGDDVLDMDIRLFLRDTRLTSLINEIGRGEQTNKDVIQEILNELEGLCNEESLGDKFTKASPRLFAWLVANEQWNSLARFPAFSTGPDDGMSEALRLGRKGEDYFEVPLAPIKAWPQDLQKYADLFPWQYIMATEFFSVMPEVDVWRLLSSQDYVRTDVVVNDHKPHADFLRDILPSGPLSEGEHRTVDAVAVTDLIFRARDRVGVMERVRNSQARARLFWNFLTEWLIARDPQGLEPIETNCECGSNHWYYSAMWLVPVARNRWVPQGSDHYPATAQSLAALLRDSDWTPQTLSDNAIARKFLKAIEVSYFDMTKHFVFSDEESHSALDDTMTNILVSTGGDLRHISDFVEDMKADKDLLQHLAERRERRKIVHENQRLGALVEDLVKEGLEGERFTVKRTGIGSDFEILYDMVEDDQEIGIELSRNGRSWLVEVKATREQRVRMTARQAETAVKHGDGFLFCVVPLANSDTDLDEDDVRANTRFVQNIGPRVEPLWTELDTLNALREDVKSRADSDIELDIQGGTARILIHDTAWQDGVRLGELATSLTDK